MSSTFRVDIVSPPDREKLAAQILVEREQVAELNQESDELRLEIYPKRSGEPWLLPYDEFVRALELAKRRLLR